MLEFENVTQGGLPIITSVSGNDSISFIEFLKSNTFFVSHSSHKIVIECLDRWQPTINTHYNIKTLLSESFRESASTAKYIYDSWFTHCS